MQNTETGVVYELPVNGDPILEVSPTFFCAMLNLQLSVADGALWCW